MDKWKLWISEKNLHEYQCFSENTVIREENEIDNFSI